MKNITVSIKDQVYHRARQRAAERKTSVSKLVEEYLQNLTGEEERMAAARTRMEELFRQTKKFTVGKVETREEIYGRRRLR